MSRIDELTQVYKDWLDQQGFADEDRGSAMEMLSAATALGLTDEQFDWLADFIHEWECEALDDPAFYEKQTISASRSHQV